MKTIRKIILTAIGAACSIMAHADEQYNSLSYTMLEYDPTPKAFAFQKSEPLSLSGNTGAMSYQVPVYQYEDRDFSIPFVLSYAYSGFRPGTPSGELGLGWSLVVGGSISREIIGFDDFRQGGYRSGEGYPSAEDIMSLDFPFGDGLEYPMFSRGGETTADIFHFSFMGHAGSFIKGSDGQYHAYGTQEGHGTYNITVTDERIITIVTADGLRWTFGSDESNTHEYLLTCDSMAEGNNRQLSNEDKSIVTWLLSKIEAPNGRRVEFTYVNTFFNTVKPQSFQDGSHDDVVTSFTPSLHTLYDGTTVYKEACLRTTAYLSEIKVYAGRNDDSGNVIARFQWSDKLSNELGDSNTQNEQNYYAPLVVPTRKLDSIILTDAGRPLRSVSMTYALQGTRTMLEKVSISGLGDYGFTYREGYLPGLMSNAVDYWGYYNGQINNGDSYTVGPTDIDYLCNETLPSGSTHMDPNWMFSRMGALTHIDYPTGGYSAVEYEANRASYILLRKSNLGVGHLEDLERIPMPDEPVEYNGVSTFLTGKYPVLTMLHSNECGGVRVKQVTDYPMTALSSVQSRSYAYESANGQSSGTINQFGRYFARKIGDTKVFNKFLKYPGTSFGENHITYGRVTETLSDGSYTVTDYTSWSDFPDYFTPLKRCRPLATDRDNANYGIFLDNILREPNSKAHLRSRPMCVSRFTSENVLLEEERTEWQEVGDMIAAYVVGSGNYWYPAKRSICDVRPRKMTHVSHFEGDANLVSVKRFMYDDLGRNSRTEETDWEGTTRISDVAFARNITRLDMPSVISHSISRASEGDTLICESTSFGYVRNGSFHVLGSVVKTLFDAQGNGTVSDSCTYSDFDIYGNPRQSTVNGRKNTYIWGYCGRYLLARIENGDFGGLPAELRSDFQGGLSDEEKTAILSLSGTLATIYDYIPSIGVSRITQPNGTCVDYDYDIHGRLVRSSDIDGDIQNIDYGNHGLFKYVRTTDYRNGAYIASETILDGLGRAGKEVVFPIFSPVHNRVTIHGYDSCGREDKVYLPYEDNDYMSSSLQRQRTYWADLHGSDEADYALGKTVWDNALSVRSTKMTAPGRVMSENDKSAVTLVKTNGADEVKLIIYDNQSGGASVRGFYAPSRLLCTAEISQDGDTTLVYRNMLGNIILERQCMGPETIDTYRVYDFQDRLIRVLTPLAIEGDAVSDDFCYVYGYDAAGNLSSKKVPGQQAFTMEYNAQHKVIVSHPSLFNGYDISLNYVYDPLGRLTTTSVSRNPEEFIPTVINSSSPRRVVRPRPLDGVFTLDSYKYAADSQGYANLPSSLAFESLSGVVDSYNPLVKGSLVSETHCLVDSTFANNRFQVVPIFAQAGADLSYLSHGEAKTAHYYNRIGDKVQTVTLWPDGSKTRISYKYNSCRQCTDVVEVYENDCVSVPGNKVWKWTTLAHTNFGEVSMKKTRCGFGNPGTSSCEVSDSCRLTYDGIGRLTSLVHVSDSSSVRVDYGYTMQGYMSEIHATLNDNGLFSESLRYWNPQNASVQPRYDGNISEIAMSGPGEMATVTGYQYDKAGRLVDQMRFGGEPGQNDVMLERNIQYDSYGNILSMQRYDADGSLHNLGYSYSGPLMTSAEDNCNGVISGKNYTYDDAGNVSAIGNVFFGRDSYRYNVLGKLAIVMAWESVGDDFLELQEVEKARFSYLADGSLYESKTTDGADRLYRGSFILKRATSGVSLDCITHDGGLFKAGQGSGGSCSLTPYCFLNDHLGSVRYVVDMPSASVVEANDYQAFGGRQTTCSDAAEGLNPFHFHGKEDVAIFGRDYSVYPARLYNPATSRWISPDPMAEKYYSVSPYAFCNNNPIIFVDPEGTREWPVNPFYNGARRRHSDNFGSDRGGRMHNGLDINMGNSGDLDLDAPILATHPGRIIRLVKEGQDNDSGGTRLIILHEVENEDKSKETVETRYMHLDSISEGLKEGSRVVEGQIIGKMGNTNNKRFKMAVHLHYELRVNNVLINPSNGPDRLIDPMLFISGINATLEPAIITEYGRIKIQLPQHVHTSNKTSLLK